MSTPLEKAEVEAFLAELRELCRKHRIAMRGTDWSEGIFSEITLWRAGEAPISWDYSEPMKQSASRWNDTHDWSFDGIDPAREPASPEP